MKPRATYRVQCHKDFGFQEIEHIAEYLARLGISHIYTSPWLKARPGSSHGYDIVDHQSLNPELGSGEAFEQMIATLDANGIGRILDFVPNHMGVGGADNPLWLDVLEWGPDSGHAGWFDIDWQPDRFQLRDKLLVPLLARQYGIELRDGKLQLKFDADEGAFAVWAYDTHKLPICPLSYQQILGDAHLELERIGDAFATIRQWRPQITRRAQELKAELAELARQRIEVREGIERALDYFNGEAGVDGSWTNLRILIEDQHWRVAHFRVAGDDINYRRFFDINELAGLRMELPAVFDHAHSLVAKLLAEGKLNGLRIDHIDGLLDPRKYLLQLRQLIGVGPYLIVEKILAHHESLRDGWPVDGTTGYEFTNLVLGLLVDPEGERAFTEYYSEFTGEYQAFADVLRECKLRIMRNEMASELNVLSREALRVACQQPETADFTQNVLRRAIREIAACCPVYRTYYDGETSTEDDRRDFQWTMKHARCHSNDVDPSVFDFLEALLSGQLVSKARSGFSRYWVLRCAMKFQQYSGPVMAKGMEDTAFYRYNRFIALNEVGGRPDLFGVSIAIFHKTTAQRMRFWPHSMLATATHDTKQGEDARARLAVLSEMPEQWATNVRLWSHTLRARRGDIEAAAPPDRNDEYRLYQLLIASWPAEMSTRETCDEAALRSYGARLKNAMRKSIREAKVHSTWAAPDIVYESAVFAFVDGLLDPVTSQAFLAVFLPFQQHVARLGVENSLIQTVLKLTVPGVPDIYQGSDLWDLSLVDPDNRRTVDFSLRMRMLTDLETGRPDLSDLMKHWQNGAVKLLVIALLLKYRALDPDLFEFGTYDALPTAGPKADCLCAFARVYNDRALVVIAARFPFRRERLPSWNGTTVATPQQFGSRVFTDVLSGRQFLASDIEIALDLVFESLNVAVFVTSS